MSHFNTYWFDSEQIMKSKQNLGNKVLLHYKITSNFAHIVSRCCVHDAKECKMLKHTDIVVACTNTTDAFDCI